MALKVFIQEAFPSFTLKINLSLPSQGYTVILGPSGAGKSLTLKIIAGLINAKLKKIELNENDISDFPPEKRGIVYLPQGISLFPHLSVRENIIFPFKAKKKPVDEKFLNEVIQTFRIEHLLERDTKKLSGGEAQRVALARAICAKPKVLLLDEPLSSLDFHLKLELMYFLKKLPEKYNLAILHVTHDPIEAIFLADYFYLICNGHVSFSGNLKNFIKELKRLKKSNSLSALHQTLNQIKEYERNTNIFQLLESFACMVNKGKSQF